MAMGREYERENNTTKEWRRDRESEIERGRKWEMEERLRDGEQKKDRWQERKIERG